MQSPSVFHPATRRARPRLPSGSVAARAARTRLIALAALVLLTPVAAHADASSVAGGSNTLTKEREAPRFYGLGFEYSIYDTSGLNKFNYTNTLDNYFFPSWSLGRVFFRGTRFSSLALGGRFVVTQPLAGYSDEFFTGTSGSGRLTPCSNLTPSANGSIDPTQVMRCPYNTTHRTDYSDIRLTLSNRAIYTIPKVGIAINPAFALLIPASEQSRVATLQASITPSLGASRSFLDGKISLGYSFSFTKYFYRNNTKVFDSTPGALNGTSTGDPTLNQSQGGVSAQDVQSNWANFLADPSRGNGSGRNNANFGLGHIFTLDLQPIDKLGFTFIYWINSAYDYPVSCASTVNGQPHDLCATGAAVAANSGSRTLETGVRDSQIFWVSANYQLLDWLALSASYITVSSVRKDDGSRRQPFISTNYDGLTTVSLGLSVTIEKAVARLQRAF